MKVWEVSVNTDMMRFYFFPKKKEAEAFVRVQRKELKDEGFDVDTHTFDISSWDIQPNAEGMARALNGLIEYTCFNEG